MNSIQFIVGGVALILKDRMNNKNFERMKSLLFVFSIHRENYNINDVLGEFSLTLIDSLDTLVVMGNVSEFQHAVKLVIDHVRFDRNSTIQVFEATIRYENFLIKISARRKSIRLYFI